jgi:hypothetical protein
MTVWSFFHLTKALGVAAVHQPAILRVTINVLEVGTRRIYELTHFGTFVMTLRETWPVELHVSFCQII